MRTIILILLQAVLSLLICSRGFSQSSQDLPSGNPLSDGQVQSLTVEDGLPQGLITGIVQDKQGFIWMGTKGGLVRYDGYQIKVFKNNPGDSRTIASNIIRSLYLDRENNIWIIYADQAIDIFNPVTQSVQHITPESALGWLSEGTSMLQFSLFEDNQHRYWVISPYGKTLQYFTLQHKIPVDIPVPDGEKIIAIGQGDRAKVWVCTDKMLYTVSDSGKRLDKIAALPEEVQYSDYRIGQMVQDKQGNWIIGNTGCVEIFNTDIRQWTIVRTAFPDKTIRFIAKAPDGKIYLNASNRVFRFNADHSFSLVWTNTEVLGDLQSMIIDRSNVLWAGTDTFGARLINLSSRGFHSYAYRYGFIFDVLNTLHYPIEKIPYGQNVTSSLYSRSAEDRYGNMWLINIAREDRPNPVPPGHLPVFKLKDGALSIVPVKTNSTGLLQIAFDLQNHCWAILTDRDSVHCHLVQIDLETGRVTHEITLNYRYNQVAYLTAFHHKLCIVYRKAIQLYDPKTKSSVLYKSKDKFGNATLLMATPDKQDDNILWIAGIGNGLMKLNVSNEKIKVYNEENGIPNNTVYAAIADKHGYLWCSSNKGIFRFNPKDNHVLSFTNNDGLQGNEFNRYHFLQTPDGRLFFGGTLGWTVFYPDSVQIDHYQPPTVITGIQVNNRSLSLLPKWKDSVITTMTSLILPYNKNFLTFSFAGLEFNQANKLPYRYQLEGIDAEWVNAGARHTASYTNLPPGDYTFKVNAGNTAGIWSDSIKLMKIVILPPWWKTWWMRTTYLLSLLAAAFIFYRYRVNRIKFKHSIILQQKEMEQLKEMDEMKTRFFSNITHEFRTPLSLIIGPLEQVHKDYSEIIPAVEKNLSLVHRNAKQLLLLINQLLDMAKIEAGNMKVSLYRGELGTFITDNVSLFHIQAEQKNIQLHVSNTLHGEYLFDADKWQKILFNLLSNAIKFTPTDGHIYVSSITDPMGISLSVRDTGVGIPEEKIPFIFNRFYQADDSSTRASGGTGIGLALVRELAELMEGTVKVKAILEWEAALPFIFR